MDYADFANEMSQLLAAGYLDVIAQATATGTGTGQPKGIITALDATPASEVQVQTAGQLAATDIFKAWNAVPERFRSRASWLMSVSAESQIRSFSSANQSSAYFTVNMNADGLTLLNGRPVYISDYAGVFIVGSTSHNNFAVVGDMSNYVIARRLGSPWRRSARYFSRSLLGVARLHLQDSAELSPTRELVPTLL